MSGSLVKISRFIMLINIISCEGISHCIIVNELSENITVIYYYDYSGSGGEEGVTTNLIPSNSRFELKFCEYPSDLLRLIIKTNSTVIYDKTNSMLVNDFKQYYSEGGGCSLTEETHELTIYTNM